MVPSDEVLGGVDNGWAGREIFREVKQDDPGAGQRRVALFRQHAVLLPSEGHHGLSHALHDVEAVAYDFVFAIGKPDSRGIPQTHDPPRFGRHIGRSL